jgi:hypothetical protein
MKFLVLVRGEKHVVPDIDPISPPPRLSGGETSIVIQVVFACQLSFEEWPGIELGITSIGGK